MKLSKKNRDILLINLHKEIEENSNTIANHIQHKRIAKLIDYPPNGGLTENEKEEILKLSGNEILKSALRKILASNSASVFFNFFSIIDGVSDPEINSNKWSEVMLVDLKESDSHQEMLHDEFYSTYWDWRGKRKNKNWKLDLYNKGK